MSYFTSCKQEIQEKQEVTFKVDLDTIVTGLNSNFVWSQTFATAYGQDQNQYLATMSKQYIVGSDNYGDLFYSLSKDGKTWTSPSVVEKSRNAEKSSRFDSVFSDVYPMWHKKTGKVLGTGKIFFYDRAQYPDPEIGRGAGYIIYDPEISKWSGLKTLGFPATTMDGDTIYRPSAGCSQRFDLENGEILLPIMYEGGWLNNDERNSSCVAKFKFDGEELTALTVGNSISMNSGRGIYEPSITKYENTFYLTMRTDHSAYVAISKDGLNYEEPVEWKFTDGRILGSYNTQQHWLANKYGLFLVYTRKGANNDHVFRHRAPLFMAKVDTASLRVMPETERVMIPERGARLGNFSAYVIDDENAILATAERIGTEVTKDSIELLKVKKLGYNNTLFFSSIKFK
tara:strand:+ start:19258 stop:20457 length:1200 start_codon:yes stop_codon:yes gene_type:complete